MENSDYTLMWVANDCSDGSPVLTKFAARFKNQRSMDKFVKAFSAAQKFNRDSRKGKDLKYADEVSDHEEKTKDDIDANVFYEEVGEEDESD